MTGRLARDDEVAAWQRDGWVLLDGLVGTDVIDAAVEELWRVFPTAGGVPRRPRRGDREVARSTGGTARRVRLARDRPRLPARATPVARRVPLSRAAPQPLVRAARGRRLHDPRAAVDRPPPLPSAVHGQVLGHDELRATHAHGSEPLVAAAADGTAVVARRIVPLPVGRRRGNGADAPRGARRLDRPVPDRPADLAAERSRHLRGRAAGSGSARFAPRLSPGRLPPRGGDDRARRRRASS